MIIHHDSQSRWTERRCAILMQMEFFHFWIGLKNFLNFRDGAAICCRAMKGGTGFCLAQLTQIPSSPKEALCASV